MMQGVLARWLNRCERGGTGGLIKEECHCHHKECSNAPALNYKAGQYEGMCLAQH